MDQKCQFYFTDIIMYNLIKVTANSEKSGKSAKNDGFSNFVKNYSSLSKSEQLEIRSISWAYDRIEERKQKVNELNHEAFLEQKITKLPDIVIGMILEWIQIQNELSILTWKQWKDIGIIVLNLETQLFTWKYQFNLGNVNFY